MVSSRTRKIPLILLGLILLITVISLSCNLPTRLGERFGVGATATPTFQPTNTPQPLPPAVVESDPPLGSTLRLTGPITLYFNQEMDQESSADAISIAPEMDASLEWIAPDTLAVHPDGKFPPGSAIEITLGTVLRAANGLSLTEEQVLLYYTPDDLEVVTILPSPDTVEVDPLSAVVVSFNQPVIELGAALSEAPPAFTISPAPAGQGEWINTSTYQFSPQPGLAGGATYRVDLSKDLLSTAGTSLDEDTLQSWTFSTFYPELLSWEPYDGDIGVPLNKSILFRFNQAMDPDSVENYFSLINGNGDSVSGSWTWTDDFREAAFLANGLFDRSTNYSGVMPAETSSAGGTPLGVDTQFGFQTTGEFRFLGTPSGQTYTTSIYEGATLYFNNPVDLDSLQDNISVIPEVSNLWPSAGASGTVLNLYGDFEPLTEYTLVLNEEIADIWGSQLENALSISFTTQALAPNMTITQGNNVLFLTGSENAIPVRGTNIYQVSINQGRIPVEDLPNFFGPGVYTALDDYYPPGVQNWTEVLNVPGDDQYTINLPLNQNGTSLAPGLYRYQIYAQELPYNPSPYLLAVSDVHLTMKTSPQDILIWGLDLSTGEELAATDITVYDQEGEEIFTGKTDSNGIFRKEFSQPIDLYENTFYAVTGQPGEDDFGITASNWAFGTEIYNFGLASNYGAPQPKTYLYTDRPIYRPGQTVYYRLIHWDPGENGFRLPAKETLTLSYHEPGKQAQEIPISLSDYGTASGSLQLSSYAEPGYYRLETEYGMVLFQVSEYRKPEIELDAALTEEQSLIGSDWQGRATARYYFDAPAGEVDLSWSLRAEPASFHLPGYQVGVIDSNWFTYPGQFSPLGWGVRVAEGSGSTDSSGYWEAGGQLSNIDIYDREVILPANYVLNVTAQDESGFSVSDQTEMLVHPSDFYIGVKQSAWIAEAGQEIEFEFLAVNWDRDPDGVHQLQADFNKVTWNYEIGEIGQYEYTREKELISSERVSTDRSGEGSLTFIPEEPGTYQLDVYGEGARTEVTLWVGGAGTTTWPTLPNQKIKLVPDQESYLPGETASVFIPNPFPDSARALITLERNRVMSYETEIINGAGELLTIELGEGDAPNVYLSVTLIGEDTEGDISFRQGYVNLLVEPTDKVLNVEVIGEPEQLGPGEEVEFTIRVTDSQGQPQQGEFSLAVVDKAVLALADPYSEDIQEAFYGVQPLSVRMGIPLGMHAGLQVLVPGGMGGGGGDIVESVRDQFEDTGFWQADILTDEKGEAVVQFRLPDNLTTWQADVRGVTQDTEVGQAETEVVTTKDFLVRPITPRFLVAGDHLALAAIVHNNTEEDLQGTISLQGSGLVLDQPESATQNVDISAGGRTRVEWWVSVADTDQADLLFQAEAGNFKDAVKPYQGPLPVYQYLSPVSFGTSGTLDQAGQALEIVSLPRTFDPQEGSLEVELSPSLAAEMLSALDALEKRESFSTEAVLSNFLPNVAAYKTLQELGVEYSQLESRLEELIPETFDALAAAQNEDGGWGWWPGGASNPEISSYVLFGLLEAQDAGIFVDELLIQNGTGYLMATLPAVDMISEPRQYDQLALRYFVLTEAGINVQAGMRILADLGEQLSPGHQGLLALALENNQPGNRWTQTLLSNLGGSAIRTGTGLHWELSPEGQSWMNSDTTLTAMVIYALARVSDAPQIVPEGVRYLVSVKTGQGDWWSAYETSWCVLALNEVLSSSGELNSEYTYSASINGRELISGSAGGTADLAAAAARLPVEGLYQEYPNAVQINRTEGEGTLYYKAQLLVYQSAENAQPFGRGMDLSRIYTDLKPAGENEFTQSGQAGDLIQVQLTLVVEHDLHYLSIEDYIPAGAEILDTRLKTSRQDLEDYPAAAPFREGWGWWYFNTPRVYDERIRWTASFLPAGTYQLTYQLSLTHPGDYQVLPAHAWQEYFPETMAVSAGDRFEITSGD